MGLNVKRCDLFPVGTVVKCFGPLLERSRAHKPSSTEVASATVDSKGNLAFATVAEGQWELWAEVGGAEVGLHVGSENFVPNPVVPGALTFGTGYLARLGAVQSGGLATNTIGVPVAATSTVAGGNPSIGWSGVIPAPLAERIQAKRLLDGCAVPGLPYS
jgi:hypothetical protein